MTRKAETPRSCALTRAMFLAAIVLPLGARLAAAQEPVAAPDSGAASDSVAAAAPTMAAPSAPDPPPATPDTMATAGQDFAPYRERILGLRWKFEP